MIEAFEVLAKAAVGLVSATGDAQRAALSVEFSKAVINANALLMTEQLKVATLTREKADLEDKLRKAKNWDAEKARYQLSTIYHGAVVFALKRVQGNGEPPHYICPACYERGERSILQLSKMSDTAMSAYACIRCKLQAPTGFRGGSAAKYAEDLQG